MDNDSKISSIGICFLYSFLYRSFYILGLLNIIISLSKNDSIFSIIISGILGISLLYGYFYLNNNLPNKNVFDKITSTFPKVISDILISIIVVLLVFISSYTLYNLSIFINYNLLNDINIIPISTLLIITVIYLVSKGINTITRVSGILIFIVIFLILISFIAVIKYSNPNNLYPLLTNNFSNIYESSLYSFILSNMPICLLLIIPKEKIENNKRYHKYMSITYIINSLYILFNFVLIISILGSKFASILNYPDIMILQKVSLLNFFERIEDLLSFKFMFDGFLFLAVAIYYIKEGMVYLFKIKPNNILNISLGIIVLIVSFYLNNISIKIIFYLSSIIILIHILLAIFIKKESKNKTNSL